MPPEIKALFPCGPRPTPPSTPITTIFSCKEPVGLPVDEPQRSTFCLSERIFNNKSLLEINQIRTQWDTFERVENYNSIVLNKLANETPNESSSGVVTPAFYQFINSAEKTDYNLGQLAHTVAYPDNVDFIKPYSSRPIPYTSTILSTINNTTISTIDSPFCANILPTKPSVGKDILLRNQKSLNLYVRVSTQVAQFPKSPYKFTSSEEYIAYNEYKKTLC